MISNSDITNAVNQCKFLVKMRQFSLDILALHTNYNSQFIRKK
jgi:hypothetical protein